MLSLSELTERPPLNGCREELVNHLAGSGKNEMQDWIFGKELEKDIAYSNHLEEFIERANINRLLKGLLKRTGLPGIRTAVAFTSTDFDPLRILALLSMYVCKLLKWGSSTSVEDLQASMLAFIDHATGRK